MKKINEMIRGFRNSAELVQTYSFDNKMSVDDVQKFIDVLFENNVKLRNFRLSNSEEQPNSFFRFFPTLREFNMFSWNSDVYIDDFGVNCLYGNKIFDLTFNFSTNHVLTFSKGDINLEPILKSLEEVIQKN